MSFSQRYLCHLSPVIIAGRTIKRYHLTVDNSPIPRHIQDAAYRYLPNLLPDYTDDTPPATVSILHLSDGDTVSLNAYSWIADHDVDYRIATAHSCTITPTTADFAPVNNPAIGCVWELPALVHERSAWVKHVLTPRQPQLDDYLADIVPNVPVGHLPPHHRQGPRPNPHATYVCAKSREITKR